MSRRNGVVLQPEPVKEILTVNLKHRICSFVKEQRFCAVSIAVYYKCGSDEIGLIVQIATSQVEALLKILTKKDFRSLMGSRL